MSGGHGVGEQAKITQVGSTTERPLRAKIDDLVSVKDFGAVGDGVHDDTAAIAAAIAYAGDFVNVYFPCPGTYQTTTWGTIPCGYQELVPATGAVPRPLGTKVQEILSAKDFGAKGDGVSDDTTAIGNLINAATGTQLINLPCPGTYVTSTHGTLACGMYYPPTTATGATLRSVPDKLLDIWTVKDFGAVGDGVHDDTAAIQAAIDASHTAGAAASVVRICVHEIHLPSGTYKITAPLSFTSLERIRFTGDGEGQSKIAVSGALSAAFDLNGIALSEFSGFSIIGLTGTDTCTYGIYLRWDNATAARSTTEITFRNVAVLNCKFVSGFKIGSDGSSLQVSETHFYDCYVDGQWTAGEVTWWQAGFQIGTGVSANCLNHWLFSITSTRVRRGLWFAAGGGLVTGAIIQSTESDVYVDGVWSFLGISGIRSENSQRFLESTNVGTPMYVSISDIDWQITSHIAADKKAITWAQGGDIVFRNVKFSNGSGAAGTLPILAFGTGAAPTNVIFQGLGIGGTQSPWAAITAASNVHVSITGYTQIADNGTTTAESGGTMLFGTAGLQMGPVGTPIVQPDTVINRDSGGILNLSATTGGIKVATPTQPIGFFGSTPISKPFLVGQKGTTPATSRLLTLMGNLGLVIDATTTGVGPFIPEDPAATIISHLYWDGAVLVDTKATVTWTMVGTVPQVAAGGGPPLAPASAGAFSTSNYYKSNSNNGPTDFVSSFYVCIIFNPSAIGADQNLASDGQQAGNGWLAQMPASGKARFWGSGNNLCTSGNTATTGALNLFCGGYNASLAKIMVQLNGGTTVLSNQASWTANTSAPATIGVQGNFVVPFTGTIYEVLIVQGVPTAGLFSQYAEAVKYQLTMAY